MSDARRATSPIRVPVEAPTKQEPIDEYINTAQFGDGRLVKMEVDYAPQVDEAIPKAEKLLKVFLE